MIVGVDEVGRGPLAGVVLACALCLKKVPPFKVKDSKALSWRCREDIFSWLQKEAIFAVGISNVQEIDQLNILKATFLAFNRAIRGVLEKKKSLSKADFIIDGNIFHTDLKIKYTCIEKADEKIKEVACASIVAKVTRDHLMNLADFLYPQWEFARHKGYPTARHFSLIKRYSLTPLHRQSFTLYKETVQ